MEDYEIKRVLLYTKEVDLRVGIYRIQNLLATKFKPEEIKKSMFVFIGKNKHSAKIYYENDFGYWLLINKAPYFKIRANDEHDSITISRDELRKLLVGLPLNDPKKQEIAI